MIALKKQRISDQKLFIYNFVWTSIDSSLCLILLIIAPFNREYEEGEMVNYAVTEWGSCVTPSGWLYLIVLGAPKLIFSIYCITMSISVYSTVSMMKFNEGLQVLVCIVVSSILIFITVAVMAGTTVNSDTSSVFVYSFMSLMVLMVCHFCCAVMVLPRIFAIWRGHDEEAVHDETKAAKEYLKKLKAHLNMAKHRFTEDLSRLSVEGSRSRDGAIKIEKRASYSVSLHKTNKGHQSEPTPLTVGSHGMMKGASMDLAPLEDHADDDANKVVEAEDSDTEVVFEANEREISITNTATDIKKGSNVFDVVPPKESDAAAGVLEEDDVDIDIEIAPNITSVYSNSDADQELVEAPVSDPD
eukprot:281030_1